MRRYVFYLSVALLAFGISSLIVFKLYWKTENISTEVQERIENNISTKGSEKIHEDLVNKTPITEEKIQFTCNNKILSAVLNDLRKDEVFDQDAQRVFKDKKVIDCGDILHIKQYVDLNNDGIKEADVRPHSSVICGASANCSLWIYRKDGRNYKKLLEGFGVSFEVKKNSTNGYKDILVIEANCCSRYLTTYKFSESEYKEDECLYVEDKKEDKISLKSCEDVRNENNLWNQ